MLDVVVIRVVGLLDVPPYSWYWVAPLTDPHDIV